MSTLDLLARRCLVTWLYRMVVVDTSLPMFNLDSNVIRVSTSKGNRCRSIMLSLN